ncbi:hypothetical protein BDV18DRAFT_152882 [Aspergillus unguis]
MSSTYYIGPFGRMLPTEDGRAEPNSDRPANLSAPGAHPYQLPPPRSSAPLQFGTDPFLHPRNRSERNETVERGYNYQQKEQLPSVSQLLTPNAHSSRSPSPYNPRAFGLYIASEDSGDPFQRARYGESSSYSYGSRPAVYESSRAYLDATVSPRPQNLPPISHISAKPVERDISTCSSPNFITSHSPYSHGLSRHYTGSPGDRTPTAIPHTNITRPASYSADGDPVKNPARQHVVDERYIEGEGLCYIYADGSHCPKIIDGVPVNANWGITKAGKPRKRLAQACLTCREKKIKCHPNLPKCDQCQKSGRECRFESAPRGHRAARASQFARKFDIGDSSAIGNSNNAGTSSSVYFAAGASESSNSLQGTSSQSPLSDDYMLTPSAMDSNHGSSTESDQQYATRLQQIARRHQTLLPHSIGSNGTSTITDCAEILTEINDPDAYNPHSSDWREDPCATDPESAIHYVETYFTHVNDRLYYIFPRSRFLLWLKSCHTKSLADHLLLYSMMALGSVFSNRPDRMAAMKRYSRIARYALENSRHDLSLQLAQSRIIISLWYYAVGALTKSGDSASAAVRTVCDLRYNVELGGVIVEQSHPCEYGLHPQALIECRRRTFWIAFLTDRLSCLYAPSTTFISSSTALLRLPCREEIYEAQEYTTVPFFQAFLNQVPSRNSDTSTLSAMALLIDVISIWGDISDHVLRSSLIPAESYSNLFEEFYGNMVRRSDQWLSRLPLHLAFTAVNLERSIHSRRVDPFISIHLLYHASLLKLNRYARARLLRPGIARKYVHAARNHAAEILRTALALERYASDYNVSPMTIEPPAKGSLLNPFLGYVILSAIDVLSAGGLLIDLRECIILVRGGLEVIRDLSFFWASTKPLLSLIERRLDAMTEAQYQASLSADGKVAFFVDGPSLDSQAQSAIQKQDTSINEDLMYGALPREQLFLAFGLVDIPYSVHNIVWVRTRA